MERFAYALRESAAATGIPRNTLRVMIRQGKIKTAKCGRSIVIPATELARITKPGTFIDYGRTPRR